VSGATMPSVLRRVDYLGGHRRAAVERPRVRAGARRQAPAGA
jgi:hypothetical protein